MCHFCFNVKAKQLFDLHYLSSEFTDGILRRFHHIISENSIYIEMLCSHFPTEAGEVYVWKCADMIQPSSNGLPLLISGLNQVSIIDTMVHHGEYEWDILFGS